MSILQSAYSASASASSSSINCASSSVIFSPGASPCRAEAFVGRARAAGGATVVVGPAESLTASHASTQSAYTSTGCDRSVPGQLWPSKSSIAQHTCDARLEVLATRLAGQVADAGLLVDLDADGSLVVAEEASEGGCEGFALVGCQSTSCHVCRRIV